MSAKSVSRINIDIDKELKKEFQIKALRNGDTMSGVLKEAIEEYLKK